MKKIIIYIIMMIAMINIASAETTSTAKYIGNNIEFGTLNVQVDLKSTEDGNIVYVENFYSENSQGRPKFYSSILYVLKEPSVFIIQRPQDRNSESYKFIEKLILINNKIVHKSSIYKIIHDNEIR